jgi:hypothetical protein
MLKQVLLASAVMIAAPVFAQDATQTTATPQSTQTTPPVESADPAAAAPTTGATPATPDASMAQDSTTAPAAQAPTAPATPSTATDTSTQSSTTTASADTAQPANGGGQVGSIVNAEFASYDKNADGDLDQTEFGAWMIALKKASDPATKDTDPATKTWANGAFASADTDKSKKVTKEELTKYLSQGAE